MRYFELIEQGYLDEFRFLNENSNSKTGSRIAIREPHGRYLLNYYDKPDSAGNYAGIIWIDNSTKKKPTWDKPVKIGNYFDTSLEGLKNQIHDALNKELDKIKKPRNPERVNINFNVKFTEEYLKDLETHYIRFTDMYGSPYLEFVRTEGEKPDNDPEWVRVSDSKAGNRIQGHFSGRTLEKYKIFANARYILELDGNFTGGDRYVFKLVWHSMVESPNDNLQLNKPAITFAAF